MKIVIDIPQYLYRDIKEAYNITLGDMYSNKIIKAIKSSVSLPKGHGDLIDKEDVLNKCKLYCEANCKYSERQRPYMCKACMLGDAMDFVDEAPIIIKGEK